MRTFPICILLTLALVAGAPALAIAKDPPKLQEDGDKFVLENEHVKIWFHGKKPMLKVFPAGNDSAGFSYKFSDVVEYRDVDSNGISANAEVVASLNLEKASAFKVERAQTDGQVVLNLSLEAPVDIAGKTLPQQLQLPDRTARISLIFTLRSEDATVGNFSVPATSIKWDFVVEKWPFLDAANDRLALVMEATGSIERTNGTAAATIETNGTSVGALGWTDTAEGRTAGGANVTVPVKVAFEAAGEGNGTGGRTRVTFTYDAADLASLLHDPTVGIASADGPGGAGGQETTGQDGGGRPVPGVGIVAAVGVLGVAAALLSRRR